MDTQKTVCIFRKFQDWDKEVIALFPEEPADTRSWHLCQSYMHVGQHSGADTGLVDTTSLATPEEYADLKAELEGLGYNLDIRKRITQRHHDARRRAWAELMGKG